MRASRAVALTASVGIVTAGALALGVAAPASATTLYNLADYAPTLPYSVLDTLPDEDQKVWTDQTRAGVVGSKPVVPLGTVPTYSTTAKLPGIFAGLSMLMSIGGQEQMITPDTSTDLWWKNPAAAKPDWIPQDEWNACAHGGDAGNFWDGVRDWMASLQGAAVGGGYDCAEIREDWLTEKNEDYEPVGNVGGPIGYPVAVTRSTGSITMLQPVWSNALYTVSNVTRKEGWVLPVNNSGTGNFYVYARLVGQSGVVPSSQGWTLFTADGSYPTATTHSSQPCGAELCVILDRAFQSVSGLAPGGSGVPAAWHLSGQYVAAPYFADNTEGYSTPAIQPLPFINPLTGSFTPGLVDMVMITSVKTRAGNQYQCQTAPFKEDAPLVPRPCEPSVPEWEIVTERITEMVPLQDVPTHVPFTVPGREIQKYVKPGPIQDWEQAFPDCDERTCKVYLMWIDAQGTEQNCYDRPDECADWYTRSDKQERFRCKYGESLAMAALIALAECTHLAQLFKEDAIDSGQAYPDPSKDPAAQPGTGTSTAPGPATPPGSGPANPTQTRNCWPDGWTWNPFDWVYLPVRCALEWAFVPRPQVLQQHASGIGNAFNGSAVSQITAALQSIMAVLPGDGGCGGIPWTFEIRGLSKTYSLLNSCEAPLAATAAVVKTVLSGVIIAASVLAVSRYFATIFGFIGYGQTRIGDGTGQGGKVKEVKAP